MRFYKHVKRANRELLEKQFKEYVRENPMSKKEIRELREWVADGHSPYDNDFDFCNEYMIPFDYITASRLMDDSEGYRISSQYNTQTDSIVLCVHFDDIDDIDDIDNVKVDVDDDIIDIRAEDLPF